MDTKGILTECRTIAIVGLSGDPLRPSYAVARYLTEQGYTVVPVNPALNGWVGLKSYPDLKSIPFKVDLVDIFRKPEAVPAVVDEAIAIGARVVWMQEGIVGGTAAGKARKAGLIVVMDKCIRKEHERLFP